MVKIKEQIIYKDLTDREKVIFNDIDFMLIGCKVNFGDRSLRRILSVLNSKHN